MSINCNICNSKLDEAIYSSEGKVSITSLCELVPQNTFVYLCNDCTHVYTPPLPDVEEYYAKEYDILIETEEEDQIVSFPDGRKEYRFDLQVKTFVSKLDINKPVKVLDYGCAKSTTLKKLSEINKYIEPHVYDVSEQYISFWSKFVNEENMATYNLKESWHNSMDIVTSFFSLEHVSEPVSMMKSIYRLLKSDGFFYCIVPNMLDNIADFIVADHVNHFTEYSMSLLMESTGFEIIEIDCNSHYGAMIVVAKKKNGKVQTSRHEPTTMNQNLKSRIKEIAEYWAKISNRISEFERKYANSKSSAIYGSGFYGALIAATLKNLSNVEYFVDQNIHKQGNNMLGKKIIGPSELPSSIELVYVGLNPAISKESISAIAEWGSRDYRYCYL